MQRIRLALSKRSYDIAIGRDLIKNCGDLLKPLKLGTDAYIITNKTLYSLYGKILNKTLKQNGFNVLFNFVPDSEKAKSAKIAFNILQRLSRYDVRKKVFIIAFGGGVIGDLAGFIAAIYKRGIPYVQIPTTLLAQVDSSIGGKVALDLPVAKNLIGAFHQPSIVISDISLLKTLPPRQIRNALAEIIKYGIIKDGVLFKYLEKNYKKILSLDPISLEYVISRSCKIKSKIVSGDEFDKNGSRATLNYGHTVGHAIEASAGYSNKYYHGEAIAIGMLIASDISQKLSMLNNADLERIKILIKNIGLPDKIEAGLISKVLIAYLHDKKFIGGKNRFVLIKKIGSACIVEDVPDLIIKNAVKSYT